MIPSSQEPLLFDFFERSLSSYTSIASFDWSCIGKRCENSHVIVNFQNDKDEKSDSIILETNQPIMALGSFSGSDPILKTTQLAALVKSGAVRYFLLNGSGGGGPGGSSQSTLMAWIT
jgi:hypothetical protein